MATEVLSRAERQERVREDLLDAASRVFARRGFYAARLAEIAREAGYTTGAVYSNFTGKEDLFLAIADREMSRRVDIAEAVAEMVRSADDVEGALAGALDAGLEQSPERVLLFFEFWSYFARRGESAPHFEERRDQVRGAIAAALEADASRRGRKLIMPASELAGALRAAINGLGFERAVERDEFSVRAARWALLTLLEAASKPK